MPVDQGASGSPSDHQGVLVIPLNAASATSHKTRKEVKIRPMTESALHTFGIKFASEDWEFLDPTIHSSTQLVSLFQEHCTTLVEEHFPRKNVVISSHDLPFFNKRLRLLQRQRQREYRHSGKSEKYLKIKKAFDEALEKAAHTYKDKIIDEVREGKRGSAYKAIKKLDTNSQNDEGFFLPAHAEAGLSNLGLVLYCMYITKI